MVDEAMQSRWPALPRLAHELNNDLGIILAECDLLELLLKDNQPALSRVQAIKEACRRVAERIAKSYMAEDSRAHRNDEPAGHSSH